MTPEISNIRPSDWQDLVTPDLIAYSASLGACARAGQWQRAVQPLGLGVGVQEEPSGKCNEQIKRKELCKGFRAQMMENQRKTKVQHEMVLGRKE